jgi:hypothetical protein
MTDKTTDIPIIELIFKGLIGELKGREEFNETTINCVESEMVSNKFSDVERLCGILENDTRKDEDS